MAMMGSGRGKGPQRAKEAAEAAVSSPLLEDINLSGAKGILVNITSGADITMGEFEEVGNTVKAFASDNATVVVGTVIDEHMEGEVRVTVVATGIGSDQRTRETPRETAAPARETVTVAARPDSEVDYRALDRPTVIRNPRVEAPEALVHGHARTDYLDIPAFLRRQAD
jgi:cell division protein FtsZ